MSTGDIAIIVGAVPLGLLSILSYWMAGTNGFREHGREALLVWASLGLMIVLTRMLDLAGAIPAGSTRHVLSVTYLAALIILVQIQFIINGGARRC